MALKSGFGVNISGLEALRDQLRSLDKRLGQNLTLTAGWNENSKYPDGTYVADVALVQEYGAIVAGSSGSGSVRIPARPFIRPCIAHNEAKWEHIISYSLKEAISDSSLTGEKILLRAATTMVADLKATINGVTTPPLSPATIMRRRAKNKYSTQALALGYDIKPLQDTGHMLRSITYFVRPGIPGKNS